MRSPSLAKLISVGALSLAVLHLVFPALAIDPVTLILLIVAVLPWLAPIFKSVELPGGLKVEFQDLERIGQDASRTNLLSTPPQKFEEPPYLLVAVEDPNLALAGLRIEIERRLRVMAKTRGLDMERQSTGQLLRLLQTRGELSQQESSVLSDLLPLLNRAVHGADVEVAAAKWAIDNGPRLLAGLDQRLYPRTEKQKEQPSQT